MFDRDNIIDEQDLAAAVGKRFGGTPRTQEWHQDRGSRVSWAIEFVRRGFWPADVITVHRPPASSADRFWGEAEAWDESGTWYTVAFQTPARHGGDRRGVRLWDAERPGTHFPVVRGSAMSHSQRRWLRIARRLA